MDRVVPPKGHKTYVKTLVKRAKGSLLDITSSSWDPASIMSVLPSHTKQIRSLNFRSNHWAKIRRFSELNCGALLPLCTLRISANGKLGLNSPDATIPLSLLLFSNAMNLQEFSLDSRSLPFLNHFVFPSLIRFELSIVQVEGFWALQLLDFLEASPMLQKLDMRLLGTMMSLGNELSSLHEMYYRAFSHACRII